MTRSTLAGPSETLRTLPSPAARLLRLTPRLMALALLAATTAACDEKLSDIAGPTPGLEPTFSSIQREILTPTCTPCHTNVGRTPAGGLNLLSDVAYGNLVSVASLQKSGAVRVVPGDPDASYLVQKLEGAAGIIGTRMPRNGTPLTGGQMLIIRRWIQQGAPNN